jgi:hypothetical protein
MPDEGRRTAATRATVPSAYARSNLQGARTGGMERQAYAHQGRARYEERRA